MLEIRLIGTFEIKCGGQSVTLSSRAAQSVFAYLVLTAGTAHRREKLAGMFWPDESEEQARAYLRTELWRIRKALTRSPNTEYLLVDNLTITFDPSSPYWLDIAALKKIGENSTADELMSSLLLYQHELLPGFYEEWVVLEREHLHAFYEARMARLLQLLESEKRWSEILEWAERWIALGDGPEAAYYYIMAAYRSLGDQVRLASTYGRCIQALHQHNLEPSARTRALAAGRISKLHIPVPLTSFIGREQELVEVRGLLRKARLVTLTGSGGVGKTRLAIQVVSEVLGFFPDGIWLIDLAPLNDSALVSNTLAELLDLHVTGCSTLSIIDLIVDFLYARKALLILDNCEHLIDPCAHIVDSLLSSCKDLKIVTTSREPLRIAGEVPYRVPSLEVPTLESTRVIDALAKTESVRLFAERAAIVSPGFYVGPHNGMVVAQICRRLDGIPLAIELAAARVNMLELEQILGRLDDRFNLLTGGLRNALPRHRTLRAAIEWGYDLLSEKEHLLFQRLAVFVGGWTLEAAEAVCSGDDIEREDVLNLLSELVYKSFVLVETVSYRNRYRSLETIRQFAREKLAISKDAEICLQAHAQYFLQLAEEAEPQLIGREQVMWVNRLETEHDNLRAALDWFVNTKKVEEAQKLGAALGRFWWMHNHLAEGRSWLKKALMNVNMPSEAYAKALCWAGILAWLQGDHEVSKKLLQESHDQSHQFGYRLGDTVSLFWLGVLTQQEGENARAREIFGECLSIFRELKNTRYIISSLNAMATLAYIEGDIEQARYLCDECLPLTRDLGDKGSMSAVLCNLGFVAKAQGDYSETRQMFEESLMISCELHDKWAIATVFTGLASVKFIEGEMMDSAQLQGVVIALLEQIGAQLGSYEDMEYDKTTSALKSVLGEAGYQNMHEMGKTLSIEQAVRIALNRDDGS